MSTTAVNRRTDLNTARRARRRFKPSWSRPYLNRASLASNKGDPMRLLLGLSALLISVSSTAGELDSHDSRFEHLVREGGYPSLVVGANRGDAVVYEKAFGVADRAQGKPATIDTLYRTGSVGKLFTATLLMILRDEGKVRLDDPVQQYLPAAVRLPTHAGGAFSITLRHLVTHTSGLPEWPDDNPTVYDAARPESLVEQYRGLTAVSLESPTGMRFRYSGLGYSLLGHVLEQVGGDSYEELLRTKLFAPLGMTDTVIRLKPAQRSRLSNHYNAENKEVARDPGSPGARWEWPTSSHITAVGDLLRFLRLQRNAGTATKGPVRGSTLAEMHTAQRLQNNWNDAIGIGWWVEPNRELGDIIWHKGGSTGFSSYIAYSKRYDIGVAILTNRYRSVEEIGRAFLLSVAHTLGPVRVPTSADAEAYWNARDWSNAAWAYEMAVRRSLDDARSWYRLGSAYDRMRDCTRAIPALDRAIELGLQATSYPLFLIARCHARRGDIAASLEKLDLSLEAGYVDEDNQLMTDADFEATRAHPRFAELAKRVFTPK